MPRTIGPVTRSMAKGMAAPKPAAPKKESVGSRPRGIGKRSAPRKAKKVEKVQEGGATDVVVHQIAPVSARPELVKRTVKKPKLKAKGKKGLAGVANPVEDTAEDVEMGDGDQVVPNGGKTDAPSEITRDSGDQTTSEGEMDFEMDPESESIGGGPVNIATVIPRRTTRVTKGKPATRKAPPRKAKQHLLPLSGEKKPKVLKRVSKTRSKPVSISSTNTDDFTSSSEVEQDNLGTDNGMVSETSEEESKVESKTSGNGISGGQRDAEVGESSASGAQLSNLESPATLECTPASSATGPEFSGALKKSQKNIDVKEVLISDTSDIPQPSQFTPGNSATGPDIQDTLKDCQKKSTKFDVNAAEIAAEIARARVETRAKEDAQRELERPALRLRGRRVGANTFRSYNPTPSITVPLNRPDYGTSSRGFQRAIPINHNGMVLRKAAPVPKTGFRHEYSKDPLGRVTQLRTRDAWGMGSLWGTRVATDIATGNRIPGEALPPVPSPTYEVKTTQVVEGTGMQKVVTAVCAWSERLLAERGRLIFGNFWTPPIMYILTHPVPTPIVHPIYTTKLVPIESQSPDSGGSSVAP